VLFDDVTVKPERDSMLVRLITLDPALPDVLDITISLYDYNSFIIPMPGKTIRGVRKDRFSEFVAFPDPMAEAPPEVSFLLYVIEGYDATTKEKVLSIEGGTNSFISFSNYIYFTPNGVLSMGIGAFDPGLNYHPPISIFEHVVE
jgi:hypothetical protein